MATKLIVFLAELQASIAVFDPVMMRITDKAGDRFVAEARPVARRKTGALRKSIKKHPAKKSLGSLTISVTAGGPSSPHDVDYAVYQELGTARMTGTHFMRKAEKKVTPQWQKELADVAELLAAGRAGKAKGALHR